MTPSNLGLVTAMVMLAACSAGAGGDVIGQGGGQAAQGDSSSGGSPGVDGGFVIDGSSGGGTTDPSCAAKTYGATRVPASVLLLLDRSLSMEDCPGTEACAESKWESARIAITGALGQAPPELRVGLSLFPASVYGGYTQCRNCLIESMTSGQVSAACAPVLDDCGCRDVNAVPNVPVDELSVSLPKIDAALIANKPDYNTPTLHALGAAYQILEGLPSDSEKYVLLMTDGDPTVHELTKQVFVPPMNWYDQPERYGACGELQDILSSAHSAATGTPTVKTFVVGSPGVTNTAFMSALAVAGGTARADGCEATGDCYYQIGATDFAADLQAVLTEIAGQVATCTFALPLDSGDVDPNKVNVSFQAGDGEAQGLARDAARQDGWDYTDGTQQKVEIFGPACEAIKASTDSSVTIELGCVTRVK